jgi:hypothetical protein
VPDTTVHVWDAITLRNPAWARLTYKSRATREAEFVAAGIPVRWFTAICDVQRPQACDEYPYFASGQSGPTQIAGPPGASVRPLWEGDNSSAGSLYRWRLIVPCLLSGSTVDVGQGNGKPFLVIPLRFAKAPVTFGICA